MSVRYLCSNIVFVLSIYLAIYLCDAASGPFLSRIVSVRECQTPYRPYMKNPPMVYVPRVLNISNTLYLSGNVTIVNDIKNVKYRMKSFTWEDNGWKLNYLMNDFNCHGILLHLICAAVSVKYDRKNCAYKKGQYYFDNLDVNAVQHFWATAMEYGRVLWKTEVFSQKLGSFFCHEFEMVNDPVKI